jgi:hypothetical protein
MLKSIELTLTPSEECGNYVAAFKSSIGEFNVFYFGLTNLPPGGIIRGVHWILSSK